ncbi:carbamoyltransferase, partial [Flavobacteriaceae bacterium]|nr:carbamoyltransferase [Flavobacteriaceae bacterium]
ACAQEERFTRIKHTPDFPSNSIKFCLEESGLQINELDAVVFYDKPLLKFERLLETYYSFAPRGLRSFLTSIPVWLNEKMFLKKQILDGLAEIETFNKKKIKLLFPEHHLSHASSTFFASAFSKSAILTIDGVGEWSTASIGYGEGNKIEILKDLNFPHSLGLLYTSFTYFLGFRVNSGEYKLMGLAPYGNPKSEETKKFIRIIKTKLVDIKEDGSIWLNQKYFDYATGLKMIKSGLWKKLFVIDVRSPDNKIEQIHCNLALAIQKVTEEIVLKMAHHAKDITKSENLCLAGGVALNCVANGVLIKENIFKNIYIQPAAGDAGGSLGAALSVYYQYFNKERVIEDGKDKMQGTYLGPTYSDKEIIIMNKKFKANYFKHEDFNTLSKYIAEKISKGNVIGWFQGKMEFGPRALGNRSILGDPRDERMQKKLNLKIKYRESFRPFAPAVLEELKDDYFELNTSSPYMLFVGDVKKKLRVNLPANYHNLPLYERLYVKRSELQAITHLDFSARVQTVSKKTNPAFWNLINDFKEITGYGALINTSFNVRGEPIVCSPEDAYKCFMNTEMDYLVINNFLYSKNKQTNIKEKNRWKIKFKDD